ncbi:MAG: hypothetical protein MUE87_06205, partial [Methanothrix sp.]|nr:hypothetical protein [Methanothrix sp.]
MRKNKNYSKASKNINKKNMSKMPISLRYWRRFMHHIKVGGVCLLVILIAAALPVGVLGQDPEAAS